MITLNHATRIGSGILTALASEIELGRFGTVCLRSRRDHYQSGDRRTGSYRSFIDLPDAGSAVRLVAEVTSVRFPVLSADTTRGLRPNRPRAGDRVELGRGTLFVQPIPRLGPVAVGVWPTPHRIGEWLDPQAVYDLDNHAVNLHTVPDESAQADT